MRLVKQMIVPEAGWRIFVPRLIALPGVERAAVAWPGTRVGPRHRGAKGRVTEMGNFQRGFNVPAGQQTHQIEIFVESEIASVPVGVENSGRHRPRRAGDAQIVLAAFVNVLEFRRREPDEPLRLIVPPLVPGGGKKSVE
ncbi:hypothetical protein SDC9_198128 [bioreactor metagenome]|uniref:Uncharacterized protein n=1 Tax=bioreactor metagenome TaxID=1076179 RepID=A0A645IGS5_9ZZZZ